MKSIFADLIIQTAFFVYSHLKERYRQLTTKNRARHFGGWDETLQTMGQDSSALRCQLYFL